METKHTKWYVGARRNTVYSDDNSSDLKIIVTSENGDEQHSATKLIAAAPELLEALIGVLNVYGLRTNKGTIGHEVITNAKKAIEKATK